MNLIFEDNFNGTGTLAAHTSDSGHTWLEGYDGYDSTTIATLTGSGNFTLPSDRSWSDIKPSITPEVDGDYRIEIDISQWSVTFDSQSIDVKIMWGGAVGSEGDYIERGVVTFQRVNGINSLSGSLRNGATGDSTSVYDLPPLTTVAVAMQRVGGVLSLEVGGVTVLTAAGAAASVGNPPGVLSFEMTFPSPHNTFYLGAVRAYTALGAPEAIVVPITWTDFLLTEESVA